jgi:hypothetical protein
MEKTEEQKQQILKELWYNRNPCHDNDQEGNDRFWGTVLCVFEDYKLALTLPIEYTYKEWMLLNYKHNTNLDR